MYESTQPAMHSSTNAALSNAHKHALYPSFSPSPSTRTNHAAISSLSSGLVG
jgi:hypothetical protein